MDLLPTFVDLAEADYPSHYNGNDILPVVGKSLAPIFQGKERPGHNSLFWELDGCRAVRKDRWKAVSLGPERQHVGHHIPAGHEGWELYNMAADPTEQNNLAARLPEKVEVLKAMWWKVATEDERLPANLKKPCADKPASFKRFMLRQGNQRVPNVDRKSE